MVSHGFLRYASNFHFIFKATTPSKMPNKKITLFFHPRLPVVFMGDFFWNSGKSKVPAPYTIPVNGITVRQGKMPLSTPQRNQVEASFRKEAVTVSLLLAVFSVFRGVSVFCGHAHCTVWFQRASCGFLSTADYGGFSTPLDMTSFQVRNRSSFHKKGHAVALENSDSLNASF